jgi:hypothetical protein
MILFLNNRQHQEMEVVMRSKSYFSFNRRFLLLAAVLFSICSAASLTHAVNPPIGPVKADVLEGNSDLAFGEWSAKWWQWALSIPLYTDTGEPNHPLFDGTDCSVGQSGHVWFLGGRFCETGKDCPLPGTVVRQCTIPNGTSLFIPIVNAEDSFLEEQQLGGTNFTIDSMRTMLAGILDTVTNLQLEVDGIAVENQKNNFRVKSPVFNFTLPDPIYNGDKPNNVFSAIEDGVYPAGTYKHQAVGDGFYVMLKPLPVGPHTIHFSGTFPNDPNDPNDDFIISMTYEITVE